MKIYATSTNFNGYKNVIFDEIIGHNSEATFISAQLDNKGLPDLDEFKKTKTLLEQPEYSINNDFISMIYTRANNEKPNLFIDNRILFWGDELRWLKENRPKAMPLEEYSSIEAAHMKAYTLFASLTKRMMTNGLYSTDEGIQNAIKSFMRILTSFTKNDNASFEIIQHSFSSDAKLEHVAEKMNKIFAKTMAVFFK